MEQIYQLFILKNVFFLAQFLLAFLTTKLVYSKIQTYRNKSSVQKNEDGKFYEKLKYINTIVLFLSLDFMLSQINPKLLNQSNWISLVIVTSIIGILLGGSVKRKMCAHSN
jgi:hypothetical protein